MPKQLMPFFRIILIQGDAQYGWSISSNPSWGHSETNSSAILFNDSNDYVEYKNCGIKHRMIRLRDLDKYGLNEKHVDLEWTLDPRSNEEKQHNQRK